MAMSSSSRSSRERTSGSAWNGFAEDRSDVRNAGSPASATTAPFCTAPACTTYTDSTNGPRCTATLIGSMRREAQVPELPEMEAWSRALAQPVRAFPIEQARPAHIAPLKTFDPPLSPLDGTRLAGDRRDRPRLGERDPPPREAVSLCLVRGAGPGTGRAPGRGDRRRALARPRAARARRRRQSRLPRPQEAR